ncbi:hypothetical protein [Pseudoduganella sp. R-34]|uniref:hypothetical protein n=1 Tax=Pseudoduganella sp. R-34 TaxID=3404062 RepID=UPI003CF861C6
MRTLTAIAADKAALVVGLKWKHLHNFGAGAKVTKEVREEAKLVQAEKVIIHSVVADSQVLGAIGLYSNNEYEPTKQKRLHSLAVAFVQAFPGDVNQILAWRLGERLSEEDRVAVIIVQNGLPIADEVKTQSEAVQLMKNALGGKMGANGHKVYTNDPVSFYNGQFNGQVVEEQAFIEHISKSNRLSAVPINPVHLLLTVGAVAGIALSGFASYEHHRQAEKAALLAKLAAQDPLPPYEDLLASNIGRMGLERNSLASTLATFGTLKVMQAGWLLEQAECAPGKCIYTWDRKGGTTSQLLAAFPGAELMPESGLGKAKLVLKSPLKQSGIASLAAAVPMSRVSIDYVNTYQLWTNAGLQVQQQDEEKEFKTWPTPTEGDVSQLPATSTLKARPISVTAPFALVQEVVASTPAAVWWTSFTVKYTPSETEKNLAVTIKGNTYVR